MAVVLAIKCDHCNAEGASEPHGLKGSVITRLQQMIVPKGWRLIRVFGTKYQVYCPNCLDHMPEQVRPEQVSIGKHNFKKGQTDVTE